MEEQIKDNIEAVRKMLQNDGGDCEFVKLEGKTVYLRLKGHCAGCPHATLTIKNGIETFLRDQVDPEIVVERV